MEGQITHIVNILSPQDLKKNYYDCMHGNSKPKEALILGDV